MVNNNFSMPKIKSNIFYKYVKQFGEDTFSTDGTILYCKICEVKVSAEKKFTVTQHIKTNKHERLLARRETRNSTENKQQLISLQPNKKSVFSHDLCKAMMCANIPLHKITNVHFRSFLEKYTLNDVPSVSTLRKTYANDCYLETMDLIRKDVIGNKIWVSIDETTDVNGRYIANVIIGTLLKDGPGKIYLLNSEVLEKANFSTITKLFDSSMFLLWPDGVRHDDVLIFLSDAAPYMKKAGTTIKALYSKVVHITCIAHGLHRVAENIRGHFPGVDRLIAKTKQVFLKAPSRVLQFKFEVPGVPLPPEPVLTRWGTWIEATSYYCQYFKQVRDVMQHFDSNDAVSINESQALLNETSMESNLSFIHSNYGFLPSIIKKLESQGVLLAESVATVSLVKQKLDEVSGEIGIKINNKYSQVLEKNDGFGTILKILKILSGESSSMDGLPEDLTGHDLAFYKYAPITSTDVERSFSRYKNLLADNRRSFEVENIKKTLVVQCNNFSGKKKNKIKNILY